MKTTRLTPATAGKVMDRLSQSDLNIVHEFTGQKRNRVYAYSDYIEILDRK